MTEWLDLLIRWIHLIAGISWIGSSFHFNWLDLNLQGPGETERRRYEGALWVIHSGGFYRMEKHRAVPEAVTDILHWVKWEALLTAISGVALLLVVYYLGGGALLVDKTIADVDTGTAMLVGLSVLVLAWPVYDLLWLSPLGRNFALGSGISFALLMCVIYGLTHVLSGRAAYIHVGAMLGTLMAGNVWFRILPSQKNLVAATRKGELPDRLHEVRAKTRSKHNNYMTLPVVFVMLSNHFPFTYGHEQNWLVLGLLVLAGASVRHAINMRPRFSTWALAGVVVAATGLFALTVEREAPAPAPVVAAPAALVPIDPATTGAIRGVVRFDGTPPPAQAIELSGGCEALHDGPARIETVLAHDGLLQNAFVWIAQGTERWQVTPASATEVVVDQRGCTYLPRVLGVRVGQSVTFVNSDPLTHNVRVLADRNRKFNLAMPARDMRISRTFDKPEVMVKAKCDIHPWMGAYVGVLAHPWFAVTGADGSFVFDGVPPGDYEVSVWHEIYGTQSRRLHVDPKGAAELAFTFAPAP